MERRAVAGRAGVGEVVVQRVQLDRRARDPRDERRQDLLQVLARVDDLGHRAVDLFLARIVRRLGVEQVVADDRDRDELALGVDHPEDAVEVGVVDQQVVRVLAFHRGLVEADGRGRGDAPQPVADLTAVPEGRGVEAGVPVPADRVAHRGVAQVPGEQRLEQRHPGPDAAHARGAAVAGRRPARTRRYARATGASRRGPRGRRRSSRCRGRMRTSRWRRCSRSGRTPRRRRAGRRRVP